MDSGGAGPLFLDSIDGRTLSLLPLMLDLPFQLVFIRVSMVGYAAVPDQRC